MLFGQDARSSKSNFIGCFDPMCHVASVVEGNKQLFIYISFIIKQNESHPFLSNVKVLHHTTSNRMIVQNTVICSIIVHSWIDDLRMQILLTIPWWCLFSQML